jgi:hypothetical protein
MEIVGLVSEPLQRTKRGGSQVGVLSKGRGRGVDGREELSGKISQTFADEVKSCRNTEKKANRIPDASEVRMA